ncbi:hypothetical protein FACS1894167_10040 [Synergistales bacterium]|nr:hypothetical protein FACS1894167_10040 [Synergistales bacterium]GHV50965.1 hypothetical protein FACS1894216_04090 [Synergistales bacterium]
MIDTGLSENALRLIQNVISGTKVTKALLFGSRAKGNFRANSDIDIALCGDITVMEAEEIAAQLELLPLPFTFDAQSFNEIKNAELREHIARVGVTLYG